MLTESIWDNRFRYVDELKRMGANIQVNNKVAVFDGVKELIGAPISACDLRAGAAMIIAGAAANGITEISAIHHVERGYEDVVGKMRGIGVQIETRDFPDPVEEPAKAG